MSFNEDELKEIAKKRSEWEEKVLKKQLARFGVKESPQKYYTPLDTQGYNFLKDVGFPGQYPFTAGKYASLAPGVQPAVGGGHASSGGGLIRAGRYSGYGTAEDTRDYYKYMIDIGRVPGINLAFDLPTQCGYDSDAPEARGEVGKTGVAIDTLRDFEVIYEPFTGKADLDKINSAWTINPMANIIVAMYVALAKKRGIPINKLNCTPQNDILKECVSRGTHIFPLKHAMRLTRDTIVFSVKQMSEMRPVSISGHHPREAGGSRELVLGLHLASGIAYLQLGVDAGLNIDDFASKITFNDSSGTLEMFKEIAYLRAARRMWAKIVKERFGAKDAKNMIYRDVGGCMMGLDNCTVQRPLNNLVRSVIGGVAEALSGYVPSCYPPFDEALGLGHSMEAIQLEQDAARIIMFEARLCDVVDPLAGSYYVEYLTDELEKAGWEVIRKIDEMGGIMASIESGWLDRQLAKDAFEKQRAIESGEQVVVGVNKFIGEGELEIGINRMVPNPYDPDKRAKAEENQINNLNKVKKQRNNQAVKSALQRLKEVAQDESANTIPPLVEAVEAYATVGEMANTLKEVFGIYQEPEL